VPDLSCTDGAHACPPDRHGPGGSLPQEDPKQYASKLDEKLYKIRLLHEQIHGILVKIGAFFSVAHLDSETIEELTNLCDSKNYVVLDSKMKKTLSDTATDNLNEIVESIENNPYIASLERLHQTIIKKTYIYRKTMAELTEIHQLREANTEKAYFLVVTPDGIILNEYDKQAKQISNLGPKPEITMDRLKDEAWCRKYVPSGEIYMLTNPCENIPPEVMTAYALTNLEYWDGEQDLDIKECSREIDNHHMYA